MSFPERIQPPTVKVLTPPTCSESSLWRRFVSNFTGDGVQLFHVSHRHTEAWVSPCPRSFRHRSGLPPSGLTDLGVRRERTPQLRLVPPHFSTSQIGCQKNQICLGTSTVPLKCHATLRGIEKLFVFGRKRRALQYPLVHTSQQRRRARNSSLELISAIKLSGVSRLIPAGGRIQHGVTEQLIRTTYGDPEWPGSALIVQSA